MATQKSADEAVPLEIRVEELKAWRNAARELVLIDVREPAEHAICRIDGAVLIPLRQLPARLGELDPAALTVVHCHHGPRSGQAVSFLRQEGFASATNLVGGIDAWSAIVDPEVPRY